MKDNVKYLNYYTVSMNMLFCIPIIIPYYADYIGLSFQDFLIAEAVFAALIVILEVPSGWLSDVWKRKNVLILAVVIYIIGSILLILANDLTDAIIAQATFGIAVSLFSGTNSAFLYDTLLAQKRENQFSKLEGKRMGLGLYSLAFACILGGFMYEVHPTLPFYAELFVLIPAIYFAYKMVEPPRVKSAVTVHPLKDMRDTMIYALHGNKEIAFIILFAAILFNGTKLIMWSQQPYYMALEIPEFYFGILFAVGALLGGFSSQMAHRLETHISNIRMLFIIFLCAIAVCMLSGFLMNWVGIALLMLGGSCLFGLANPRVDNAINMRVGSERRATILSTKNLLVQLLFIPSSLILGYFVSHHSIGVGLYSIIGWLMLGGLCIALWEVMKARTTIS